MTQARPNTKKAAIWALDDEGLEPAAIAARLGCKTQTVYARLSEKRQALRLTEEWTDARRAKALRIHRAALEVIAAAFGVAVAELRMVLQLAEGDPQRAAPPRGHGGQTNTTKPSQTDSTIPAEKTAKTMPALSASAVPVGKPSASPTLFVPTLRSTAKPAAPTSPATDANVVALSRPGKSKPVADKPRIYGLRAIDGQWLTKNGRDFTCDVDLAWSGTAEDVKRGRSTLENARFCKQRELPNG